MFSLCLTCLTGVLASPQTSCVLGFPAPVEWGAAVRNELSPGPPKPALLSLPPPRGCLEMLLLFLLLLLLFLLLLPLARLRQQQSLGPRPSWLACLQHRVAWGALWWAAAWQRWRLEQSTLHAGRSQQQALRWCLKGAPGPRCPLRGSTGVFSRVWGGGPERRKPHGTVRFQNLKTPPSHPLLPTQRGLPQRPSPGSGWVFPSWTLVAPPPRPIPCHSSSLPQQSHQS